MLRFGFCFISVLKGTRGSTKLNLIFFNALSLVAFTRFLFSDRLTKPDCFGIGVFSLGSITNLRLGLPMANREKELEFNASVNDQCGG